MVCHDSRWDISAINTFLTDEKFLTINRITDAFEMTIVD